MNPIHSGGIKLYFRKFHIMLISSPSSVVSCSFVFASGTKTFRIYVIFRNCVFCVGGKKKENLRKMFGRINRSNSSYHHKIGNNFRKSTVNIYCKDLQEKIKFCNISNESFIFQVCFTLSQHHDIMSV